MPEQLDFSKSCLVLNYDYRPLNITSTRRAFILVYLDKAHLVSSNVIRLNHMVKMKYLVSLPSKNNIFSRDKNLCGYCGSPKNLTLDHIIPRSRGGDVSWKNLVTCCYKCNNSKGDRTPDEAGMILRVRPYHPKIATNVNFHKFMHVVNDPEWKKYLSYYLDE